MAGRYWISGVQLGLIKGFLETDYQAPSRSFMDDLFHEIEEDQFIGNIENYDKQKIEIVEEE